MAGHEAGNGRKFAIVLSIFQVLFITLFGVFARYGPDAIPQSQRPSSDTNAVSSFAQTSTVGPYSPTHAIGDYYPMFQDVHVMMFIGFGYLMTFLRKYGYSSLGINFLLAAFVIQWATLMRGFLHMFLHREWSFAINMTTLLTSDFTAAAVLITFGAVLGKLSPLQYLMMAFIEVTIVTANEFVGVEFFRTQDVGGSIFVHVFGAYFGLAFSRVLYRWEYGVTQFNTLKYTTPTTDLFSMIGTIFLWMFWPSFNSAMAAEELQQRAVINTYFALASCCVATFICSFLFHKGKISMELVQNATLAGGVAIGSTADMVVYPFGALIIGFGAGVLSCVGFHFINGVLESKLKVHDTCGVNNLHGMPGILAALISAVVCATATESIYGTSLTKVFPALAGNTDGTAGRSALMQAGWQLAALGMTLAVALLSGALTGFIVRMKIWDPLPGPALFDDERYWALPDDVPPEQEQQIRNRLQSASRDSYELAVPLTVNPVIYNKSNDR